MRNIVIAISTIFQNSGDATRAIEIAKIIQKTKPKDINLKIVFISRGSQFEKKALDLGFEIFKANPKMKGIKYQEDFNSKFGELIGNENLAKEILKGEIEAYNSIEPDLLIYGFWPIGSIAKRMIIPSIKSVAFLPLPLKEAFLKEKHTFPDELFLSRLPKKIQEILFKIIPTAIAKKNPALRHSIIRKSAEKMGYKGKSLINVFEMLKSDLYLINDIPQFYNTKIYGDNCIFTGAIFSQNNKDEKIVDENINNILSKENKHKKIFCSLGSSGKKEYLFEIIKVFNSEKGLSYSGIVLCPPSVCDIKEAKNLLKNKNVYITDKFVPAKLINAKVDLVICHGGQGTLQTAITSEVPIIGVASQPEQKINLEHLDNFGSTIRIPMWNLKTKNIEKQIDKIFNNYEYYKSKAIELKKIYEKSNAEKIISENIWRILNINN